MKRIAPLLFLLAAFLIGLIIGKSSPQLLSRSEIWLRQTHQSRATIK